jgi:hypothetical protein
MRACLKQIFLAGLVAALPSTGYTQAASNLTICKKAASGAIALRVRKCKSGEVKVSNISSLRGANGSNGSDGVDGSLRIYGDGSAGVLHVTSFTEFINSGDPHQQFTDVTIDAGVTLWVPSGMVLRCNGSFHNRGTITVFTHGSGTNTDNFGGPTLTIVSRGAPAAGHVARVASNGEFGPKTTSLIGGQGGDSYNYGAARALLKPGVMGGGPGGGAAVSSDGGNGGGAFTILAASSLVNEGSISANGADGSSGTGGGGGGIIILASKTSISNTGTISATGGNGGESGPRAAAGGGGSGGIVHLLAPSVTAGTITLTGGAAGSTAIAVGQTFDLRSGGGGGGACGGSGGVGSDVRASTDSPANFQPGASAGSVGVSFTTLTDPTALF